MPEWLREGTELIQSVNEALDLHIHQASAELALHLLILRHDARKLENISVKAGRVGEEFALYGPFGPDCRPCTG